VPTHAPFFAIIKMIKPKKG